MRSPPREQTHCPTCGKKYTFVNFPFKKGGEWMCAEEGVLKVIPVIHFEGLMK